MMFAKVRGQFKGWTAAFSHDAQDPTKSTVKVDIDAASIDTREAQRDGHLKSPDFFDVAKFPKLTFKSTKIESAGGKGHYKLTGDLTIRDVTRPVTLDVEQTGGGKDPWGNQRIGFAVKGAISREQWGLKWNQALETGGVLVSDKVEIEAEVQVVQPAASASASARRFRDLVPQVGSSSPRRRRAWNRGLQPERVARRLLPTSAAPESREDASDHGAEGPVTRSGPRPAPPSTTPSRSRCRCNRSPCDDDPLASGFTVETELSAAMHCSTSLALM